MKTRLLAGWAGVLLCLASCNSDAPVSASADVSLEARLTVTRVATHPFLARYNLRLALTGQSGCSTETELFPDTGYVSRRNLYRASNGLFYLICQFDARVVDIPRCTITLAEFRSLDPHVTFLGSFDENEQKRWTYLPAGQRPERPFEKR